MSGAGPIRTWLPVMPWRPGHISLAVVTPWSFRQVSTIHWNGRLNWKRPGKLPNLPSRFRQSWVTSLPPFFHVLFFVLLRLSSPRMASPYVMNANVRVVGSGSWGKAGLDSLRNLYVCTWDILWTCIPLQDWVAFWTLCRFVGKQVLAFKRWREQDTASSSRRFRVMGLTKASFGTTKAETSATCNFHRSAQWQLFPKFHEALWQPFFRTIITYCT